MTEFSIAPEHNGESLLRIVYVRLSAALDWRWEDNPNQHDLESIANSIIRYGFRDPVEYDSKAEIVTSGHGRLAATKYLFENREDFGLSKVPPRGVAVAKDDSEWLVPVTFGAESSLAVAKKYAIDANNTAFLGGVGMTPIKVADMWGDAETYARVLADVGPTVTTSPEDVTSILRIIERRNKPSEESEFETEDEFEDENVRDSGSHRVILRMSQATFDRYKELIEGLLKDSDIDEASIVVEALENYGFDN